MIDSMIMAPIEGAVDTPAAEAVTVPPLASGDTATRTDLDLLRAQSLVIPVAGVQAKDLVNSFVDARGDSRTHNALDILAPRNTPVLSAASGKLVKLHSSVAGGLTIYTLDPTSRFVFLYGHLERYRPGIKEGMALTKGDTIGFVGTTGNAPPGTPHLHFQVMRSENPTDWWKGVPVNPFLIFRAR